MTCRISILVPTALAAGVLLLTACGDKDAGAVSPGKVASTSSSSAEDGSTQDLARRKSGIAVSDPGSGDEIDPVNCGEVDLGTDTHHELIADSAPDGRVGCTEAFNVVDELTNLPDDQLSAASLGYVQLPSEWFCTIDDGETANISCGKDDLGDVYGLTLHTEQQAG